MKKKTAAAVYSLCMIIITSCTSQNNVLQIVPDESYYDKPENLIPIGDITETMNGTGTADLPDWMFEFITGGIAGAEKIEFYNDRYLFIGDNEGVNFTALNKWAENYSVLKDFPRLAAARIEKRLISAASLYPDDEYGVFFEMLIKKAFDTEYPGAVKEETYWIKIKKSNEFDNAQDETDDPLQIYKFFVLISIDKAIMQTVIRNMTAEVIAECRPTRYQNISINRLQQTFFEGF